MSGRAAVTQCAAADGRKQYKQESDVMIYTVLPADENEILGYNTILCIRDSLHLLFKCATVPVCCYPRKN